MKTVIIVTALLALCSGHVIPADNSHYVEGESRYVWMHDAEGSNILVDLDEPVDEELLMARNGANNQYRLYTRRNLHVPQVIVLGNANTISQSNYDPRRNLNIIVHGWTQDGNSPINPLLTSEFLARQDCNVIVVDWGALANSTYNTAVAGVPNVGEHLGIFLNWLVSVTGSNWNQFHLIGFGLGAHIVGIAGRHTGGRIARITGLDPAGPRWYENPNRLGPNSGHYVEAIHTDGYALGIFIRSGNADFYVNNGWHPQPGCLTHRCSHNYAIEAFALSIRSVIYGIECQNLLKTPIGPCNGAQFPMGNDDVNKRGSGIYRVTRLRPWPFKTTEDNIQTINSNIET